MQVTEQDMRNALGSELADIRHRQETILQCNDAFEFGTNADIADDFLEMAKDDEKNLKLLETAITNFGIRVSPKEATIKIADVLRSVVCDPKAQPLEKMGAYGLLKQNQVMCSHLFHKSVQQVAKADITAAVAPFDGVYASFSKQMAMLTAHMEKTGVALITGEEAKTGLFGRMRDAVSTTAGAILSKTAKPADEMSILDLLTLDHRKVDMLFTEIRKTTDHKQAFDLFHQLKADLTSHSIAEEDTVYLRFLSNSDIHELLEDSKQEHEDMRALMDDISDFQDDEQQFRDQIDDLENLVKHHVNQEEDEVYKFIRENANDEALLQLSKDFTAAKQKIQENVGTEEIIASAQNQNPKSKQGTIPMQN